MIPIRVLLVDDEPLANAGLRALLHPHQDFEIVGESLSGRDAVREIARLSPDLVFLDVQMPRLGGFGVLREVMAVPGCRLPGVIFVTGYDEFAVNAFEVQALDYLLKPVAEDRFRRALARVRQLRTADAARERAADLEGRIRALLEEISGNSTAVAAPAPVYRERLMVSSGARATLIEVDSIDWIGASDYCAELHVGGTCHLIRESVTALEAELDPLRFLRVHRSAIVNLGRVAGIRRRAMRGLDLVLTSGARVPVARSRKRALLERLGPAR